MFINTQGVLSYMSLPDLTTLKPYHLPVSTSFKPNLESLLNEFSSDGAIPSLSHLKDGEYDSSANNSSAYKIFLAALSTEEGRVPIFLFPSQRRDPQEYVFILRGDEASPSHSPLGEETSSIRLEGLGDLLGSPSEEVSRGFVLLDLLADGMLFSRLMPEHPQSILPVEARSYKFILMEDESDIFQFLPVPLSEEDDLILLSVKSSFFESSYVTPFAFRHSSTYYALPRNELIGAFQHVFETDKKSISLDEGGMINRVLASYTAYLRDPFNTYYAKQVLQQSLRETLPQKLSERWAALRQQYRQDILAVQRGERT